MEDDNTFAFAEDIAVKVKGKEMTLGGFDVEAVKAKSASGVTGKIQMASGMTIQWGQIVVTPTAANTPTALAVEFYIPYKSIPFVVTNPASTAPGTVVIGTCAGSITETGFDAILTRSNTTATGIRWLAIGFCENE